MTTEKAKNLILKLDQDNPGDIDGILDELHESAFNAGYEAARYQFEEI